MNEAACTLIDALGGTSAVARMTKTATSTVHSWRSIGITESRMDHKRPVGAWQKFDESGDGLNVEGKIAIKSDAGRDAHALVE